MGTNTRKFGKSAGDIRLNERLHLFFQHWLNFLARRFASIECAGGSAFHHALHDTDDDLFSFVSAHVRQPVDDVSQHFVVNRGAHELSQSGRLVAVVRDVDPAGVLVAHLRELMT